ILLSHADNGCSSTSVHGPGVDENEREANSFAASLLMPASLFRGDVKKLRPDFSRLRSLADSYQVSLTAVSLRFLRFTAECCILLWVPGFGKVAWFQKSDAAKPWYVRTELPADSLVAGVQSGEQAVCGPVLAHCWLENYGGADTCRIREEACAIGSWGH